MNIFKFRRHTVMKERSVGTRLPTQEYWALRDLAEHHHVTVSQFIKGIIVDALVEEGFDARRFRSPGDTQGREASQNLRASGQ